MAKAPDSAHDLLSTSTVAPSPFLKWAGGKARLMAQFQPWMPEDFNHYFEPFVGGGAVYFTMRPPEATLTDVNPRLIECYTAIRDEPIALMDELAKHRSRHCKDHYYRCRTRMNAPRGLNAVSRAALMIYLNKTCFNGLYRENSRGEFNVPMGSYKSPNIFNPDHIFAVSAQLQSTNLRVASFEHVLESAEPGDFVYFDPPYVPLTETSSFTNYSKGGFDMSMQHKLARIFDELSRRGCYVMLSNSDTPAVRELFEGWRIIGIQASRAINSRASARGPVGEVLVRSW